MKKIVLEDLEVINVLEVDVEGEAIFVKNDKDDLIGMLLYDEESGWLIKNGSSSFFINVEPSNIHLQTLTECIKFYMKKHNFSFFINLKIYKR